jgi:uncharacterized protein (DUF433 family)
MYKKRITINPEIMLGKPIIVGTRITVEAILTKLAAGESPEEVTECFPTISMEDVMAALSYSADVVGREEMIDH